MSKTASLRPDWQPVHCAENVNLYQRPQPHKADLSQIAVPVSLLASSVFLSFY